MKKIGIIGCGVIGTEFALAITNRMADKAVLSAVCEPNDEAVLKLANRLGTSLVKNVSIEELISSVDLVVEAASPVVVPDVVKQTLSAKTDILVMSVGGLVGYENLFDLARENDTNLYIPTGAISGLDCIKAAKVAGITSAVIITRKPPKGLAGAPYVIENNIDLAAISTETVLFEGSARDAVSAFPKNINVAAALSFAGIGVDKTKVCIMTSPNYTTNSHEIVVEGAFGKLTAKTENVPAPNNPKTSYLAAISGVATLENILNPIKVGT